MPGKALDRIDCKILDILQEDGSISNLELAEKVNLSPTPCLRRVRQMEESGIISRQVTLLDPTEIGLDLTIYISICLDSQTPEQLANFERSVSEYPEVVECALITGSDADYLLKVVMPDMAGYQNFLLNELNLIPGIASIRTSFRLRSVVERTQLPLGHVRRK